MELKTLTDIKKSLNIDSSVQKIYKYLEEIGILEKRFRRSSKSDEIKSFWHITDYKYGINIESNFSNSTTPKFIEFELKPILEDKFLKENRK